MAESPHAAALKMYDGALRALDTKSQIYLAFLTITMFPAFGRLAGLELPLIVRAGEMALFMGAMLSFTICLYPRRGRRAENGLFDTSLKGERVAVLLTEVGETLDLGPNVATLHDIYRVKARAVAFGIVLVALYATTVACSYFL